MIGQCRATINKHILISGSSVCAYSFIIGTYSVLVINIPTSFHITSTLYQRQDREENKQVHACSELWSVARFSLAHEEAGGPGERKRQGRRHVTGDATAWWRHRPAGSRHHWPQRQPLRPRFFFTGGNRAVYRGYRCYRWGTVTVPSGSNRSQNSNLNLN
jgi:hypothetical protein